MESFVGITTQPIIEWLFVPVLPFVYRGGSRNNKEREMASVEHEPVTGAFSGVQGYRAPDHGVRGRRPGAESFLAFERQQNL